MIKLKKKSRLIYCILFFYTIAALLTPLKISNYLPKPLGAQCMYLMLNGIYQDHAAVRCACWLSVLLLICVIGLPLLKKRRLIKKLSCIIVAAYCLLDCVILIVFPSFVPMPVWFEGQTGCTILYAAMEILGDLLLAGFAVLQISTGSKTENTNSDDSSEPGRRI
ncbi:MAG: hypothetical protein IJH52_07585 [Oscillospiraceae bacterium]|nr:hypothetical protein [Oscillospiraceae bacterium]